jgi:hypothetical protein
LGEVFDYLWFRSDGTEEGYATERYLR